MTFFLISHVCWQRWLWTMAIISFLKGEGGTCIIWNQGICYLLAYAVPTTLHGDPIPDLKRSGLGEQHILPMQLKFGWNRLFFFFPQPDKTGKIWAWYLSPCFYLYMPPHCLVPQSSVIASLLSSWVSGWVSFALFLQPLPPGFSGLIANLHILV